MKSFESEKQDFQLLRVIRSVYMILDITSAASCNLWRNL